MEFFRTLATTSFERTPGRQAYRYINLFVYNNLRVNLIHQTAGTRRCSACIMVQADAAVADGACDVQLLEMVTVPAAAKGPLRALALGLDDKHRFCVCMIELVQLACVNNVVSLLLMKTLAVHLSRSACMRSASTEADAASTSITCSVVCPFWPSSSLPDP